MPVQRFCNRTNRRLRLRRLAFGLPRDNRFESRSDRRNPESCSRCESPSTRYGGGRGQLIEGRAVWRHGLPSQRSVCVECHGGRASRGPRRGGVPSEALCLAVSIHLQAIRGSPDLPGKSRARIDTQAAATRNPCREGPDEQRDRQRIESFRTNRQEPHASDPPASARREPLRSRGNCPGVWFTPVGAFFLVVIPHGKST